MLLLVNISLLIGLFSQFLLYKTKKHQYSNKSIFYLTKLDERLELLLGSGGRPLSV